MAAPLALLDALDPDQRTAATHPGGPLEVIAGAGTGKTRVLTARIAWLISSGRARPEAVCAVAFMNDAARQIRERLAVALGEPAARRVWVGTSHRLAARVLRGQAARFGRAARFSIWDEHDVDAALAAIPIDTPRAVARTRARASAEQLAPPHAGRAGKGDHALRDTLSAYEQAKRVSSAFDFDDLLRYAVIALESDDGLRAAVGRRFTHVLVDEFQDLNPAQYRLVALIAGGHRRLTVLGDPRQAICAYRSATAAANFGALAADFPDTHWMSLGRNHRSTGAILAAANRLARDLPSPRGTDLWTTGEQAGHVAVVRCADGGEETERITAWARAGPRGQRRAVLARMNAQLAPVEQALLAAGVPVVVVGAAAFAERAGIRDALAALALAANSRDRLAFARVAAAAGRGVGPGTCRALFAHADDHPGQSLLDHGVNAAIPGLTARQASALRDLCRPLLAASRELDAGARRLGDQVVAVLVASGQPDRLRRTAAGRARGPTRARAERRLRNLRALVHLARAYDQRSERAILGDLLADLALDRDARRPDPDTVVLSTIHRAKGLEFDHVWLAGAEEGRLPHRRALAEESEPEERRLAYVAVTRARRTLYVSWVEARGARAREPSRYLADLGDRHGT